MIIRSTSGVSSPFPDPPALANTALVYHVREITDPRPLRIPLGTLPVMVDPYMIQIDHRKTYTPGSI